MRDRAVPGWCRLLVGGGLLGVTPRPAPAQPTPAQPATAQPAHASSPDRAAARASLLATDRAHAARSGRSLTLGFPTALDRDVVLLYPGAPVVRGRAAAESLMKALPDAPHRALRWRAVLAEVSSDGLRGYTLGYGASVVPDSTTPVRYLAYWRRTPAGAWHVAAWVLAAGTPTPLAATGDAAATAPPLAAPCATSAAGAPRTGATEHDLRAADSAFSARSARDGAGAAFAAFIAPDGVAVSGTAGMTCGPAAVGTLLAGFGPGALVWTPTLGDVAGSGDLGMTVGTATVRAAGDTSASKYLTVWRRQRDGAWRFVADAGNAAPRVATTARPSAARVRSTPPVARPAVTQPSTTRGPRSR